MNKKIKLIIPICAALLVGITAISVYIATAGGKLDLDLTPPETTPALTEKVAAALASVIYAPITDEAGAVVTNEDGTPQVYINIPNDIAVEFALRYEDEGITDEQLEKLCDFYRQKGKIPAYGFDSYPYQEAVIMGEIDPKLPKLDLKTAKKIISENNTFDEIMAEFEKIQAHPDWAGGSGVSIREYFCDDNIVIYVILEGEYIGWEKKDENGEIIDSEEIFAGNRR